MLEYDKFLLLTTFLACYCYKSNNIYNAFDYWLKNGAIIKNTICL